jgi:hypothetical protein
VQCSSKANLKTNKPNKIKTQYVLDVLGLDEPSTSPTLHNQQTPDALDKVRRACISETPAHLGGRGEGGGDGFEVRFEVRVEFDGVGGSVAAGSTRDDDERCGRGKGLGERLGAREGEMEGGGSVDCRVGDAREGGDERGRASGQGGEVLGEEDRVGGARLEGASYGVDRIRRSSTLDRQLVHDGHVVRRGRGERSLFGGEELEVFGCGLGGSLDADNGRVEGGVALDELDDELEGGAIIGTGVEGEEEVGVTREGGRGVEGSIDKESDVARCYQRGSVSTVLGLANRSTHPLQRRS